MSKKKTFEQAKKEIAEKYPHLKLLKFNGNYNTALFLDKDYGEFKGNYKYVLRGHKNHPTRSKKEKLEKFKKTSLKKYGVENPFQNEEIKDKIKKTCLEKHNVEYYVQSNEFKEKSKKTLFDNYKVKSPLKSNIIKQKYKQTCINKYGVDNISKLDFIKDKKKASFLKKYGVEFYSQTQDFKNFIKKYSLNKFGVDHFLSSSNIRNKIKKTNLEKYGVENVFQNEAVKEKVKKTNLKNGKWHNINEMSLIEYYKNSKLNKFAYSTVQQNYNKYGNKALKEDHYNFLHGKSKIANLWLESIEKQLGYSLVREYHIPTTFYHVDGYDPKTNTIYEFYGDFWHGYPFKKLGINKVKNNSFNTLYYKTLDKEEKILELGYNIVYLWENDFI